VTGPKARPQRGLRATDRAAQQLGTARVRCIERQRLIVEANPEVDQRSAALPLRLPRRALRLANDLRIQAPGTLKMAEPGIRQRHRVEGPHSLIQARHRFGQREARRGVLGRLVGSAEIHQRERQCRFEPAELIGRSLRLPACPQRI